MGRFDSHWEKAYKKLAEDYFDLGDKYDQLNEDVDKWQALEEADKFKTDILGMLDTQPLFFTYKGMHYTKILEPIDPNDLWALDRMKARNNYLKWEKENSHTWTVDTAGVVEPVGQYKIVVTKIEDTKENTNGS